MVIASTVQAARQLGAQAEWSESSAQLVRTLESAGPVVLLCALALLALRAAHQRRRYRVDSVMGQGAQELVRAALAGAEQRTSGEIAPVVVGRSDRHADAEWLSALAVALGGSVLLVGALPWHLPGWLLACQIGLGALGFLLACALPAWKRMFVSEARASEVAEEQALQEFQRLELHRTEARTGVLLFVSLFERRVVVLGDSGIHARVGDAQWQRARDAVLAGIERGSLAEGLVEGVRACGDVLAQHFPRAEGDRNEVPDRLIVRPE
jgi:putative membrane protein